MKHSLLRFTTKAKKVLLSFSDISSKVESKELFFAIEKTGGMGKDLIESLELSIGGLEKKVDLGDLVTGAFYEALRLKHPYVGTEHLLLSLLNVNNVDLYEDAQERLAKMSIFPQILGDKDKEDTPGLVELFAANLNFQVASDYKADYIERESFELLLSTLLQKENPNPLIVGETGVGKRSLVKLLAHKLNVMDVPANLLGYQIYEVDLLSFITENLNKGNLDTSLATFFAELKGFKRIIIYLKNFENLFFSTNAGVAVPLIFNSFRTHLEDNDIKYMATLSSDIYSRLSMENTQILSNFTVLNLSEPDEETTKQIMKAKAAYLSEEHGVRFGPKILEYIYEKAQDSLSDAKFPQKAIDLMDQSGAKVLLRKSRVPEEYKDLLEESVLLTQGLDRSLEFRKYDEALEIRRLITAIEGEMTANEKKMFGSRTHAVTKQDVDKALEDYGRENKAVFEQNISSLSTLEDRLKQRVVGQEEAISSVSRALLRSRLGLRSKKRPLGNFLFLGPTGVGKTELAKVLADEFFGEESLIRLDMSDFAEKHTVARLVGAPPGYVGYGEGGELTSKIEKNPASLVLFDEIEKAHPDVLNILLQIMEEGELVDAKGTAFDFSSAVVILTSNLGTEIVHRPGIGFEAKVLNDSSLEKRLKNNLKKILKPELLNRLDEVVVFNRLTQDDQYKILDLLLDEIRKNLKAQDVQIRISSKVKDLLLEAGYSDEYGARALRRTVEREFLDRIAEVLLDHRKRPLKLSALVRSNKISIRSL